MTELPEDDQYRAECDDIDRDFEDAYNDWRPEVPLPPAPLAAESDQSISGAQTTALSLECGRLSGHAKLLLYAIRPALLNRARDLLQAYGKLLKRQGNQLSIANRRHLLREKTRKELSETRQHQWARIVDPLIKAHHEWDQEQTNIRSLFDGPWDDLQRDVWRFENEMERGLAGPPRRQILHRTAVESGAGASQSQVPSEHAPTPGAELRRLRERLCWTQAELAARVKIHESSIARHERDEVKISGKNARAYAECFSRKLEEQIRPAMFRPQESQKSH